MNIVKKAWNGLRLNDVIGVALAGTIAIGFGQIGKSQAPQSRPLIGTARQAEGGPLVPIYDPTFPPISLKYECRMRDGPADAPPNKAEFPVSIYQFWDKEKGHWLVLADPSGQRSRDPDVEAKAAYRSDGTLEWTFRPRNQGTLKEVHYNPMLRGRVTPEVLAQYVSPKEDCTALPDQEARAGDLYMADGILR